MTGHAGATEGAMGMLHRLADVVHLLAAATWLAALSVLLAGLFGRTEADILTSRLAGFAKTGSIIVLILLATGIFNTLAITGWPIPRTVLASKWSMVLAAKLGLFAIMLSLAALNRWILTPALMQDGDTTAISRLRASLMAEAAAGTAIILFVSLLGLLDPAA